MWKLLGGFLLSLAPSLVAKVMTILGFTIFSYLGITTFINSLISSSTGSYSAVNGVVHSFLNIAGFDQALSIVGSAVISRIGLLALKRFRLA
jgi:hypothetical protein